MKKRTNKLLSIVLVLIMLIGIMPGSVFAASVSDGITTDEGNILIPFQKKWDDVNNVQGFRPASLNISLYKYSSDSFNIDTAVLVETKTISANTDWACTFDVSDEPILDGSGNTFKWKVLESNVDKYTESVHFDPSVIFTPPSAEDGWQRITPCSELQITSSGTFKSVVVAKKGSDYIIWTVDALSDAERKAIFESAAENIKGFGQGNYENATFISGVGGSFNGMTVTLDKITFSAPKDWSFFATGMYSKSSTEANGAGITNKYVPEKVNVEGSKTWDDKNDQDGARPDSITINLLANGQPVDSKVVTAKDNWAWNFTDLPKYENGQLINYSITEDAVAEYSTTYNGYNVTNSYTPKQISITVSKAWSDGNNQDGIRPNDVTVKLLADGKDTGKTLVLSKETQWTGSFSGLDKFKDGKAIEYTVEEVAVKGYNSVVSGDMENGFTVTNSHTYIPQTGDDSTPLLWLALMAVSGMMIVIAGKGLRSGKRR